VIREILVTECGAMTAEEIIAAWPEGAGVPQKPGRRTVERDLAEAPDILRSGRGTKGNSFRFSSTAIPMLTGNEIGSEDHTRQLTSSAF